MAARKHTLAPRIIGKRVARPALDEARAARVLQFWMRGQC